MPKKTTAPIERKFKKRVCTFCKEKAQYIDYKDLKILRKYISDRSKIKPRRVSGNCARHQRMLAQAIKRAREMALIPYTTRKVKSG